jgi:prepilin-type N-terminal cleavage/methylation domain-containing protein
MNRSGRRQEDRGQTLVEIVMAIVLFAVLAAGANALFWNAGEGVLYGRKLVDAIRLGENALENIEGTDWNGTGNWISSPKVETIRGFRVVQSAEDMEWSGKGFRPGGSDTGYRRITVQVFPPEDGNPNPFQWTRLLVRP